MPTKPLDADQILRIMRGEPSYETRERAEQIAKIRELFLAGEDATAVRMLADPPELMRSPVPRKLLPCYMECPGQTHTAMSNGRLLGNNFQFVARPQLPFRASYLLLDAAIAPHLNVLAIRVGMSEQLVAVGPVPGSLFAWGGPFGEIKPDAEGFVTVKIDAAGAERMPLPISMPACHVGTDMLVAVTFKDDAPASALAGGAIYGAFYGIIPPGF